jgi:acyl transferase domain-containing protein
MNFSTEASYAEAVAVIGMAGRFAASPDLNGFWNNLVHGYQAAHRLTPLELEANGCPRSLSGHARFVPVTARMEDVDLFDADFFGFTATEAREMDPQLRLLLETSWHAFENAGYTPGDKQGPWLRTGVFSGLTASSYWLCHVRPDAYNNSAMNYHRTSILNGQDFASTWISYKFGLGGPSLNIQTACSTGLVVVASACQNLLDYSCDLALAASAQMLHPRGWGYVAESGGILSPEGLCRPFDAAAAGTVPGEGVAAVVLKRLGDAVRDGDTIKAVIRGYGLSNDGNLRAGYAAPSAAGQAAAISAALSMAGLEADEVSYVETHGTGTYLGDPIEFAGLSKAFSGRKRPCLLGSMKANFGHLGTAAGLASFIKTALMLKHGYIPPLVNFQRINPEIPLEGSPFQIVDQGCAWPEDRPMIAGVSAFGFGGTNCHVIMEGAADWARPTDQASREALPPHPFVRHRHWIELPREEVDNTAAAPASGETGGDALRELILTIWRDTFGRPAITESDDFYAMGGTSMTAIQILAEIENALGINMSMTEFITIRTPRQLLDKLACRAE